jgi:hypothetical protein
LRRSTAISTNSSSLVRSIIAYSSFKSINSDIHKV